MTTILFHFDFLSPYAYLAATEIRALADRCGAEVEYAPVLLAGLLNHHGQKGPAEIPAKRIYVFKDMLRRAALHGVPIRMPPTHPFNPLLALRAVLAAPPALRGTMTDGLFAAAWTDKSELGLEHVETVAGVAREIGLDPEELLARAGSPEIKDALRRGTEEAIAAGVFGVPTMRVGSELFWGLESFDLLELHLRGRDPLTPELIATLREPPASASR